MIGEPPNARERKALNNLSSTGCEHVAKLYVGKKSVESLFRKGWIEYCPGTMTGLEKVRITEAGLAARMTPFPKKAPRRAKLAMLKPVVKTLDHSMAKPGPSKRRP